MSKARPKPLSFNTTMRNPDRLEKFLEILAKYEGQILSNSIIFDVCYEVIMRKLYVTMTQKRVLEWKNILYSEESYTREQAVEIIQMTPQKHKEKGFDAGWESRFDTWYKLSMEFGFCYYSMGERIEISELGHRLIEAYNETPANNEMIQNIFLHAMTKFQTSTPFRKNTNQNVPLLLLLRVLNKLKADKSENQAGIFRKEIAFFLCWKDNDADRLYRYIKKFRKKYGFNYSDELIYEKCLEFFTDAEHPNIDSLKSYIKFDKLMKETPDEYIRKMRITGIISLRGNGRFLDLNTLESEKINYLLANYGKPVKIKDRRAYYNYLKNCDDNLLKIQEKPIDNTDLKQSVLLKYAQIYTDEKLERELILTYKGESKDELLKFIESPTRLEFLTAVALVKYFPEVKVSPNYTVDDEGLPKFTAGAGKADIECENDEVQGIVEVTLMTGVAQQTEHEVASIDDHLSKLENHSLKLSLALFIAPIIRERAMRYLNFLNLTYHTESHHGGIIPILIADVVKKFSETEYFRNLAENPEVAV